jgi:hypothetical protein
VHPDEAAPSNTTLRSVVARGRPSGARPPAVWPPVLTPAGTRPPDARPDTQVLARPPAVRPPVLARPASTRLPDAHPDARPPNTRLAPASHLLESGDGSETRHGAMTSVAEHGARRNWRRAAGEEDGRPPIRKGQLQS